MPVKTGIAGDKYFEVLSGLKDGDQVITGPFNSVRNLKDGDEVKIEPKDKQKARRSRRHEPVVRSQRPTAMTQILDAIGIALASIWANKLRSFMMVLGNIVAVTSIIAVVSLIQGMNALRRRRDRHATSAPARSRSSRIGVITDDEEERARGGATRDVTIARRARRSSAFSARSSTR